MQDLANIFIKSIFIDNMVFAYFLGMCSYLAVSKTVKTSIGLGLAVVFVLGIFALVSKWYKKASKGQAIVKTGFGGTNVSFNGKVIVPVFNKMEMMDISLKTILIERNGKDGLVCKDNMRADIKVAFFVRINEIAEQNKKFEVVSE